MILMKRKKRLERNLINKKRKKERKKINLIKIILKRVQKKMKKTKNVGSGKEGHFRSECPGRVIELGELDVRKENPEKEI